MREQKMCPALLPTTLSAFIRRAARTSALLAVVLATSAMPALAEKADRDRPTNLLADSGTANDAKGTYNLLGNVIITKGTLAIRADKVDAREDAQGFFFALATANPGSRVSYRQKRDTAPGEPDEYVEATANQLDYDGKQDVIKLIGNAVVKRLRNGQLADESTGELIVIDNLKSEFSVTGKPQATAENPKGRVQFVLSPRNTASAPTAPATPADRGALKSSPKLEDKK
jgi:lipopolysaccharide export system protein LptA